MIPDAFKNRLIALVLMAVFALISAGALCTTAIIALSHEMSPVWASLLVSGIVLLITGVCAMAAFRPDRSTEAEFDAATEHAADELAHLPVNIVRTAVSDRPMTAVVAAAALGYGVGHNPSEAARIAALVKELLE